MFSKFHHSQRVSLFNEEKQHFFIRGLYFIHRYMCRIHITHLLTYSHIAHSVIFAMYVNSTLHELYRVRVCYTIKFVCVCISSSRLHHSHYDVLTIQSANVFIDFSQASPVVVLALKRIFVLHRVSHTSIYFYG